MLNEPSIAMVGAHKASVSRVALAKHFASSLGASGLTIVSGLALGLNGSCHQGALDAQADTIVILGSDLGQTSVLSTRHYCRWWVTCFTLAPHGKTPWL